MGDGRAGGHALFASLTVLHAAVVARLHRTTEAEQLAFLRGHPMLSPRTLLSGTTMESTADTDARCVARFVTDDGGRVPSQLIGGGLAAGSYEWRLDTAAYFTASGMATPDCNFLPVVVLRSAVADSG